MIRLTLEKNDTICRGENAHQTERLQGDHMEVAMVITESHIVMHNPTWTYMQGKCVSLSAWDALVFCLGVKGKKIECPAWSTAESDVVTSAVTSGCALSLLNKVVSLSSGLPHPASF